MKQGRPLNDQLLITAIGARVKTLRQKQNMTQSELAQAVGVSHQSRVSQVETGTDSFSLGRLVKIADLFGVSLDYLCGREPAKEVA